MSYHQGEKVGTPRGKSGYTKGKKWVHQGEKVGTLEALKIALEP